MWQIPQNQKCQYLLEQLQSHNEQQFHQNASILHPSKSVISTICMKDIWVKLLFLSGHKKTMQLWILNLSLQSPVSLLIEKQVRNLASESFFNFIFFKTYNFSPENQWNEKIRTFNYPYHPSKTDFLDEQPYHVQEQRDKPIGPPLKVPIETHREALHTNAVPVQTQSSSILKSLLDAPDDEPEFQQIMKRQTTSPRCLKAEERQWKRLVGNALKQRSKPAQRRFMSKREEELRRWYAANSGASTSSNFTKQRPPLIVNRQQSMQNYQMTYERSFSTNDLTDANSMLRDRLLSPSMPSQLNSIGQVREMEVDHSSWRRVRRKSLPSTCGVFDALMTSEEACMIERGPLDGLFYGRQIGDRYLKCEDEKEKRGFVLKGRKFSEIELKRKGWFISWVL